MEKNQTKKPMSNKTFAGIWGTVLTVVSIAVVVANLVAMRYQTIITRSLGHATSKIVNLDTSGKSDYFKSDYDSAEALHEHEAELSRQIEGEGLVLLKNEEKALPLKSGESLTLFSADGKFLYGGSGSGAIDESNVLSLKDAMTEEGFQAEEEVYSEKTSASGDTALVTISRLGHEANDMKEADLSLKDNEVAMMDYLNKNFKKVIVLINAGNAIELGWLNQYDHIQAALWAGYPGQEGITSIAGAISGRINPSGKLVDTYATDVNSSPAMANFVNVDITNAILDKAGKKKFNSYGEGIYVGYRYYETRYEDSVLGKGNADSKTGSSTGKGWEYENEVVYPFGYGLSYTDFAHENFALKDKGDSFEVSLKVTNKGKAAGKDVVEIYFQSPYTEYDQENHVEKAAAELCGYAKTQELKPGQSELVKVTVPKEELRAYDYTKAKTYILDAGTYYFTAGRDAHDAVNNILAVKGADSAKMTGQGDADLTGTFEQKQLDTSVYSKDSATGTEITNQFDTASLKYFDDSYTYLSRNDWSGTWPAVYGEGDDKGKYSLEASQEMLDISQKDNYQPDPADTMPTLDSGKGLKLISMKGKDYSDQGWEDILDCLTLDEMKDMVRFGGWQTVQMNSISKPVSADQDGPAGISDTLIASHTNCMGYPIQVVLASTWNDSLVEELGKCVGEDGLAAGIQGWYAPGAGTHRTPYGGRNFEYYAEDGFLSGMICAAEVRGAQSKGMYCYLKHFVLNDQEEFRYGISTYTNEQALREIYMETFEKAVKFADCHGMMAAFNGVGGQWCGANKALLTNVLRQEWGFHGIVVTDYASANEAFMWTDMGLEAGSDIWLNTDTTVYDLSAADNDATYVTNMRNAAHNVLYTVVNSAAMNGFDQDTEIKTVLPTWKYWLIALDVVMAALVLGGILIIRKRCRNNL